MLNTLEGVEKTTQEWVDDKKIQYVEFPQALVGKYQSYTKADLTNLTMSGEYSKNFATVEEGVNSYVTQLAAAR